MPPNNRPLLIGITGNIGSGKSTFCNFLKDFGLKVISADEIANECLLYPEVIQALVHRYSENILNGSGYQIINRSKLAALVFDNQEETEFLNALIHPLVLKEFSYITASSSDAYLAFEVPLLFEAQLEDCFDYLVLTYLPLELRITRLENRGESLESILKRQKRQIADENKINKVDLVIYNHLGKDTLRQAARDFVNALPQINHRELRPFFCHKIT